MEPNTAPQPNAGGSQGQSLDPSVVALTKSIGQAESGGSYTAGDGTGDNANSQGAYQMTPGFLEQWAPAAGVKYTSGEILTPAQQDQIAYNTVKTMGTTGDPAYQSLGKLSPAQIASAWNTGDPNAYLDTDYGKNNTYGSTTAYVDKVEQEYNNLSGSSAPTANTTTSLETPNSSGPSLTDWILGLGGAAGGWLASNAGKYLANPIKDAAIDAGIGAVTGGGPEDLPADAIGAGTGVIQGIVQDFAGSDSPSTPTDSGTTESQTSTQTPLPQGTQANNVQKSQVAPTASTEPATAPDENIVAGNQAAKTISQATNQMLGSTIQGRKMQSDPQVQAGIEEMAMNGYAPEVGEDGTADYDSAIKKSRQDSFGVHEAIAPMLEAEGGVGDIDQTAEEAIKDMRNKKGYTESDREEGEKAIRSEIEKYHKSYGNGGKKGNRKMSLSHFDKMRSETGHGRKWDMNESNAKREALKSLSMASRRTVEKNTKHKELYNRAMKKQQRLINAEKVMKRLNKKKVPLHSSAWKSALNAAGKYAALYIGDKIGGPLGAILGSMVGDYVTKKADKKFGKTIFETPAMHRGLSILQKAQPQAYAILKNELKKAGIVTPQGKENFYKKGSSKDTQMKKGTDRITGRATGFSAHEDKKPPSAALKALMKRDIPKSVGLKNLMKPLPSNERKGQMPGLISVKRR